MAHTCIQDWEQCLTALEKSHDQTQIDISSITSSIGNLNSRLSPLKSLPTSITQLIAMCQQCQDTVNNLTALFNSSPNPFSSSTPYNPEGNESS
jgi:prefoldin subunit 5